MLLCLCVFEFVDACVRETALGESGRPDLSL